jgi:parallel beta-helix repeat protein
VAELANARIGANLPEDGGAIAGNTIVNNGADGILVTNKATAQIIQNTISSNFGNGISVTASASASTGANTINANTLAGVAASGRSYVNLGVVGKLPAPDATTTKNAQFGVACTTGASVSGNINVAAALNGGVTQFGPGADTFDPTCPRQPVNLQLTTPLLAYVDVPQPNASVNGSLFVSGWAFEAIPLSTVQVVVDSLVMGQAIYGFPRRA